MNDYISNPRRRQTALPSHRRSPLGFTLVEMLTVMGVIVILVGILFGALKYARNSAAQSRTKAQLDTLRGMLAELDSANKLSQSPPVWAWYDKAPTPVGITPPTPAPPSFPLVSVISNPTWTANTWTVGSTVYNADFWKYPFSLVNSNAAGTTPKWDALDSPGDVGTDGAPQQSLQRNASFAILNTQLAMQMLAAVPVNKSAMDNLPANSKMLPVYQATGAPLQATQAPTTFTGLLKEDGSDAPVATGVGYVQGVHVAFGGKYFVCLLSPPTIAPAPGGNTSWADETVNAGQTTAPRGAPILLDGWGNPILYVPATGLHVKLLNGQSSYLPSDPPGATPTSGAQQYIIISPEGSVSGNLGTNPVVTRPGRPFFASAGPDGDFTKGDDNVYSFGN